MDEEIKLICVLMGVGLVSLALTYLGIRGLQDKGNKIDYKDKNFLIIGIIGDVFFLLSLIFYGFNYFLHVNIMDKQFFLRIEAIGIFLALFIGGLHGFVNCKDYRKDIMYYRIYTYQIGLGVIGFLGLVLYFSIWGWIK